MAEHPATEELVRRNLESIKRAYAAIEHGRSELVLDIVHPDVVVRDRPESPDPRTYRGHAGVREALESSDDTFDSFELIPQEFIPVEDYVVVVLTMRGTGRGSGIRVEERIAHQWKIRDGKAVAMQVYSDPDDAVRDARASA